MRNPRRQRSLCRRHVAALVRGLLRVAPLFAVAACGGPTTATIELHDLAVRGGRDLSVLPGDAAIVASVDAGLPSVDSASAPPVDSAGRPLLDASVAPAVDATVTPPGDAAIAAGPGTVIGPCRIFPPDNPWNQDVSAAPVSANASTWLATMHTTSTLHADWGTVADQYGIPYSLGTGAPPQHMTWTTSWGAAESDQIACSDGYPFCYPIPLTASIEGGPQSSSGSDRHVLYLDTAGAPDHCTLYEIYNAQNPGSSGWSAQNGAVFPLGTNALRPDGWTSSDAAGLPVLPGLVRYDEVKAGLITHALRFTLSSTYQGYIHPATHAAGSSNISLPPMGLRLRLRRSVDISGFSKEAQVVLTAMKTYGLILADNGSNWFISGDTNDGWSTPSSGGNTVIDNITSAFGKVHGSDFEIVDTGTLSAAGL